MLLKSRTCSSGLKRRVLPHKKVRPKVRPFLFSRNGKGTNSCVCIISVPFFRELGLNPEPMRGDAAPIRS